MITTVLFDLGDVVTDGSASSIRRHLISLGIDARRAREATAPSMRRLNRGEIGIGELAAEVSAASGIGISPDEASSVLQRAAHPQEPMVAVVRSLHGRYRLAVASNNNHSTVGVMARDHPGFLALFGRCYFSCDMGVEKPDREFFLRILSDLHADPGECLLIDDKEENCEAARALGMQAIRFEGREALLAQLRMLALLPGA